MRFFCKSNNHEFLKDISKVFSFRVRTYGSTPSGVLWKNSRGQQLRFRVLSGILTDLNSTAKVSINDFGCGYGALYDFLLKIPSMGELNYFGYDISKDMIETARKYKHDRRATYKKASKIDTDQESGLYYANAQEYLAFCKIFSTKVTLIDNYQLDEWTIYIHR